MDSQKKKKKCLILHGYTHTNIYIYMNNHKYLLS